MFFVLRVFFDGFRLIILLRLVGICFDLVVLVLREKVMILWVMMMVFLEFELLFILEGLCEFGIVLYGDFVLMGFVVN